MKMEVGNGGQFSPVLLQLQYKNRIDTDQAKVEFCVLDFCCEFYSLRQLNIAMNIIITNSVTLSSHRVFMFSHSLLIDNAKMASVISHARRHNNKVTGSERLRAPS